MQQRGFRSVFVKLFVSVMLALTLFAVAMVLLTQLVHDKDATIRSQVLATQILNQVDPFLVDLNNAAVKNNRLQARFMLAVIKKSFDIFDESLQAKMGLYDHDGHLLMQTNNSDLPTQLPEKPSWISRVFPVLSDTPTQQVQVTSATGYILLFESRLPPKKPAFSAALNLFTGTILLLFIMAIVLWWIARSMTWRINQLSQQMTQLGDGDFSARVTVRGNDELAALAKGFNQAAQKIEQLVNANNLLLAHASHELRTPITRIRLQIEMMDMLAAELSADTKAKFDKRAQAINRDLTGLNDLVESILLVSRLDAGHALQQVERMDLYDLVNQERQHYPESTLIGEHIVIEGQPQLLTHLIRNLLNNAMLHGVPPITIMLYGIETIEQAGEVPKRLVERLVDTGFEFSDHEQAVATLEALTRAEEQSALASTEESTEQPSSTAVSVKKQAGDATLPKGLESNPANSTLTASEEEEANNTKDLSRISANATVANQDTIPTEQLLNSVGEPDQQRSSVQEEDSDCPIKEVLEVIDDKTSPLQSSEKDKTADSSDNQPAMSSLKENLFKKRLRKSKSEKTEDGLPPANFAVLAVIDEGNGIPIDKREEIFSPFVRLQQKKKGSGLGLSLVSQIVTAHQGRITTDTINGHTRFLVVIPIDASRSALVEELDASIALPFTSSLAQQKGRK